MKGTRREVGVDPRDWLASHDVLAYLHDADPAEMGREALAMAGVDAVERFPDLAAEIAAAMLDESKSDICFRKVFRNRK